ASIEAGWTLCRAGSSATLLLIVADAEPRTALRAAHALRGDDPTRFDLHLFATRSFDRIRLLAFDLGGEPRHMVIERDHARPADLDAVVELAAGQGESGLRLAEHWARALDRARLGDRFFREFRAARARVADAWTGIPRAALSERRQLALLFLSRLLFLCFLQREGHLGGDREFLGTLVRDTLERGGRGSLHERALVPLFFRALNTPADRRDRTARRLGPLPYLNGGLFERHALERRHERLDLPDAVVVDVVDAFLARYRFTSRDAGATGGAGGDTAELGIDPEMLGRVFEGLMQPQKRAALGTYYTPAAVVRRLVEGALVAWLCASPGLHPAAARALVRDGAAPTDRELRRRLAERVAAATVLDPACGSGAFLLGALDRIARLLAVLETGDEALARRRTVAHALHGVDIDEDAALLCSLRLWLALTFATPARAAPVPLPNLDRRIRQGDALLGPLDLGAADDAAPPWRAGAARPAVREALRRLRPLTARYVAAGPDEKRTLLPRLRAAEAGLAEAWLRTRLRRLERRQA
ncbi:MAG: N-6 DNA methylase, partial [Longimicrobiales bacterium]